MSVLSSHPPSDTLPWTWLGFILKNPILRFANETFGKENAFAQMITPCPLRTTFAI
jgi:hypothetical protein